MKSFTTQYNTNENLTIKMEIIQYKIYNINKILYNLDKKLYNTNEKVQMMQSLACHKNQCFFIVDLYTVLFIITIF